MEESMYYFNELYKKQCLGNDLVLLGWPVNDELFKYLKSYNKVIDAVCTIINLELDIRDTHQIITISELYKMSKNTNIIVDIAHLNNQLYIKTLNTLIEIGFKNTYYFDIRLVKYKYLNDSISTNPLMYTNRVSIELSNICNYAGEHKKCPITKIESRKNKSILPSKIVYKTLESLSKHNFDGRISFHTYNEPTIDPRLLNFIKDAHQSCPDAEIIILTNGFYFDQVIANEFIDAGVTHIEVSAYSKVEFSRLINIKVSAPYSVYRAYSESNFDDRLNIYEFDTDKNLNIPCYAALNDIIVSHDARLSLCCMDWNRNYNFGDLHKMKLEEIILDSGLYEIFLDLSMGKREFQICKACSNSKISKKFVWNSNEIVFKTPEVIQIE